MSDPFIAEMRIFAGNFAPRGWAFCSGQLLPIAQWQALFSILGTTYGGNGQTTFALPDLRGRFPIHAGTGPGLTERTLGERGGAIAESLTLAQIPAHRHALRAAAGTATTNLPSNQVALAATAAATAKVYRPASNLTVTSAPLSSTGGSQPHANQPPYLGLNIIIALEGVFPSLN